MFRAEGAEEIFDHHAPLAYRAADRLPFLTVAPTGGGQDFYCQTLLRAEGAPEIFFTF